MFGWYRTLLSLISCFIVVSSDTLDSKSLDLIHRNLTDFTSLNTFYRALLQDVRSHRPIDIVHSPINISKIRLNDYDEEYLENSCYETMSDLLFSHGYNRSDTQLSPSDIQSLLPAILSTVENPGCARQSPPSRAKTFSQVWILGVILIVVMKLIHLITFSVVGEHCLSLTSVGLSKSLANPTEATDHERSVSIKSRLWLGLGFNAFTCGIMLGTIIFHLIPHIYDVPNENFEYTYLLRATVIFFGVYLFFIVEKLLRFRFKIDEEQSSPPADVDDATRKESDPTMIQMGRMCSTLRTSGESDHPHKHLTPPAKISLQHIDSDDDNEADRPLNNESVMPTKITSIDLPHQRRNLILYHIINDFSNDLIYGCGLSCALAHDRFIGAMLSLMIFSEGFRRHSQTISQLGRKLGLYFLLVSIVFLLLGYGLGGSLLEVNRRTNDSFVYIRTEYIYSIVYGALFYTALVTLIPELNDFGHHLQITLRQTDQTSKQRRLIKTFILICQNLFLIIGVIIALVLASIWRFYHRKHIYDYVCSRDASRLFCYRS